MGKGFLKHFHLGGKAKQNYLQKLKNGEKYRSMPGKSDVSLGQGLRRLSGRSGRVRHMKSDKEIVCRTKTW